MTEFNLSDLVMLQMVGGLDRFNSALVQGEDPSQIVEETRAKATTPNLFPEIVRKTIETQFADPSTAVRELGQNALDAYDLEHVPKRIDFTTQGNGNGLVLSVRDYGVGMRPVDVIRNLLIPYNSGKEFDITKIGEHGIGWFSVMDISDRVEVTTRNGADRTTYADLKKGEQDWGVDVQLSDRDFHGTDVKLHIDRSGFDAGKVRKSLERHLGFASSAEVDLTLNGEKVNVFDQRYRLAGESTIRNKGLEGILGLYMSVDREARYDTVTLTQNGLFIKNTDNPFEGDTLHHDFLYTLGRHGVHFWVDVPVNIGLTKGRNNIVASDSDRVNAALYPAFEQAVLEVILEDTHIVQELDHQIAEMVEKIFENTYAASKAKVRKRLAEYLREQVAKLPQIARALLPAGDGSYRSSEVTVDRKSGNEVARISTISGRDYFLEIPAQQRTHVDKQAREKRKQYISDVTGLSRKIITKKFIPAMILDSSGAIHTDRVSVEDMIVAYDIKSLYSWYQGQPMGNVGIYVNGSNSVVNSVMRILNRDVAELDRVYNEELEKRRRLEEWRNRPASTRFGWDSSRWVSEYFERTGRKTFQRIAETEGAAWEHVFFLDVVDYLDGLVSQSNGIPRSYFAVHNESTWREEVDIAHTNKSGISFNQYTHPVQGYLATVREGRVDDRTMDSLLEVLLHEKAHCVVEEWDPHANHGKDFYVEKKKGLRDKLLAHLQREGIDPLKQVNTMVSGIPKSRRLYGSDLAEMIRKYS